MGWDPGDFEQQLSAAVNALDRARVAVLCADLIEYLAASEQLYPPDAARQHLRTLRSKRFLRHVAAVADWFLRTQPEEAWITRDLAQGLLDQGHVTAAIGVLERLLRDPSLDADLRYEAMGLVGRAHKQIYLQGNTRLEPIKDSLHHALRSYFEVYRLAPATHHWHGINVVSLLQRAERDGISGLSSMPAATSIAADIVTSIAERERTGQLTPWDHATAAEAHIALGYHAEPHVALGHHAEAGRALERFVTEVKGDAFVLEGTYRQLTELVQLDTRSGEERFLIDILRNAVLHREKGGFTADPGEVRERALYPAQVASGLEKVFGPDSYVMHSWLRTAFTRAAAVARMKRRGRTLGTGFVVHGSVLNPTWDHQVLLTNNHVMSQQPALHQLRPGDAEISFDALETGPFRVAGTPLFESPVHELDVTIVRLDKPVDGVEPIPLAAQLPQMCDPPPRMYVIGHPLGSDLAYSLQDNHLLGVSTRRIHYRSPTEQGSSGSPVFDERWELVAIHRKGDEGIQRLDDATKTYDANEGVPIQTIRAAIAARQ